ncbi:hypothetical protein GCM10007071_19620 [Marinobacter zhanjiangensis]|uniref:Uncharacterized protein n=1 Tax=Marinobacter zhanjiangensis TaxID=578215 RepID=A0ABQ3AZH7_9GAMM|nr:hypothetical protein GCM10007071_19620 [Marinobacter zhanjiangensis]
MAYSDGANYVPGQGSTDHDYPDSFENPQPAVAGRSGAGDPDWRYHRMAYGIATEGER